MATYLIDTNVMLAGSAVHDFLSRLAVEAMPREAELRQRVYNWLKDFDMSEHVILMDEENLIRDEYERNMPFNKGMQAQEYGLQVLQYKQDRNLVEYVPVDVLDANGERIAILSDDLTAIVKDREDRKWVASAQSANILFDSKAPIVYGAESDWYKIEGALQPHGIVFHRLLPEEWYEQGKKKGVQQVTAAFFRLDRKSTRLNSSH